ncbi:MAG: hypothetical protein M4D85_09890, partial [Actinomycetota bacterium]|nr:hypothetical protein [Actinomycetota bacterium]
MSSLASRRRSGAVLVMLVLAALLLLTVDYRQHGGGPLATARRGALTTLAPVQEGAAALARPVGALVAEVGRL